MKSDIVLQGNNLDTFQKQSSGITLSKNTKIPNPTLGTIQMVEQTLSEMKEYPTKNKLWRSLPRQIQYPSLKVILKYLEESNKILQDEDGTIVWTFADNSKLENLAQGQSLLDQ